jgi:hypothetical protein
VFRIRSRLGSNQHLSSAGLPVTERDLPYPMNAEPLLAGVLSAMHAHRLEAILIGNAAAAIHGAPVTTVDFDFMFRETATNLRRLKAVARDLEGVILRPYYPASKLYRLTNDDRGLQVDFMPVVDGLRSFEGLRARAERMMLANQPLVIAALRDVIASKKAAGRPRDYAVMEILERTCDEKERHEKRPRSDKKSGA